MVDRTCSVDGCENSHVAKGLCDRHYRRWRNHGDPLAGRNFGLTSCSVEGCARSHYGRGWCRVHYNRWRQTGDPSGGGPLRIFGDDDARFRSKVDRAETCWLWTGALNNSGYGTIKINGVTVGAHRHSFELAGRVIPDGLDLDHLCSVRRCVNPDHLEPVTRAENLRRAIERGEDA